MSGGWDKQLGSRESPLNRFAVLDSLKFQVRRQEGTRNEGRIFRVAILDIEKNDQKSRPRKWVSVKHVNPFPDDIWGLRR